MNKRIKRITRIALFSAIIIAIQLIIPSIPLPFFQVPFTLQTLMVMLVAVLLPPSDAFISLVLYIMIGAFGLPVFSGFKGGIHVLFGPTGGFIFAFPFAALFISSLKGKKTFVRLLILNICFGIVFVYMIGAISLALYNYESYLVILYGLLTLIPFDIIKAVIASYIGKQMKMFINIKKEE